MTIDEKNPSIRIFRNLEVKNKDGLFQQLAGISSEMKAVQEAGIGKAEIQTELWARENLHATTLGNGVIFPHTRFRNLTELTIVIANLVPPLETETPDNRPVQIVCMLLIPESQPMEALKFMARFAYCVREKEAFEYFYSMIESGNHPKLFSMLNLVDKKTLSACDIMRPCSAFATPAMPLKGPPN